MIQNTSFAYTPSEEESEKASNSYVMSLIAIMVGLPLPILNLLATFIFFLANRKASYFVRWHCMQALLSQLSLLVINSVLFWWTVAIVFQNETADNRYFAYLIVALTFNLIEFIVTIYTAIQTRKGKHITWWFYSDLTNAICKER